MGKREGLASMLQDARARTLQVVEDLTEEQLDVPRLGIVNHVLWEMGHVGWFQERWVLRHLRGESPLYPHGDSWWDSFRVPQALRWELPLPSREETRGYLREVLDRANLDGLRGGAWPTRARILRNTWRNFFTPDRRDIFAGFRTCAR